MAAGEGSDVGTQLAKDMLAALIDANKGAEATRELLISIRDLMAKEAKARKDMMDALDGVADRLEVLLVTGDILGDVARNGSHITIKDFVKALQSADQEVFGDEEEGDGGEDGGDGDDPESGGDPSPAIGGRRRHRPD